MPSPQRLDLGIGFRKQQEEYLRCTLQMARLLIQRSDAFLQQSKRFASRVSEKDMDARVGKDVEMALSTLEEVLYNVSPADSPLAFAGVQSELAVVYIRRLSGRPDENLEAAISALERSSAALSAELKRRGADHASFDMPAAPGAAASAINRKKQSQPLDKFGRPVSGGGYGAKQNGAGSGAETGAGRGSGSGGGEGEEPEAEVAIEELQGRFVKCLSRLGDCYLRRRIGSRRSNREEAIDCLRRAAASLEPGSTGWCAAQLRVSNQ